MLCDWCNTSTPCLQRTHRITKDGHTLVIEYCANCLRKTEVEYAKKETIYRVKDED